MQMCHLPVECIRFFSYYMYPIVLYVIVMIAKAKSSMLLSAFNLTMMKKKDMYYC